MLKKWGCPRQDQSVQGLAVATMPRKTLHCISSINSTWYDSGANTNTVTLEH